MPWYAAWMNKLASDIIRQGQIIVPAGTRRGRTLSNALKRAMDLVLGSILLIATLPVLGVFALLIRLESKGRAIYHVLADSAPARPPSVGWW